MREPRFGAGLQMALQGACSRAEIRDPGSEILSSPADGPPGGLFEIRDPRSEIRDPEHLDFIRQP